MTCHVDDDRCQRVGVARGPGTAYPRPPPQEELLHLHNGKIYEKEPIEHFAKCPVEWDGRCNCVLEMLPHEEVSPEAVEPHAEMSRFQTDSAISGCFGDTRDASQMSIDQPTVKTVHCTVADARRGCQARTIRRRSGRKQPARSAISPVAQAAGTAVVTRKGPQAKPSKSSLSLQTPTQR